ncbi:PKD domain-containing protein [uncultured Chitinophaga sp.]|jgi:Predicted peptidase|uniref:PKD domain-containing protein n=1 Tax=uncultured Chitinophaga sp. TaxID=339340 RepID=UPI00263A2C22|nr:PKD domain-containing protein [uncultured Chitinophaga sp.]
MKNLYEVDQRCRPLRNRIRLLLLLFTLSLYLTAVGQMKNVPRDLPASFTNMTGYYEAVPQDYNANPSKKYPLLIVLHGVGELAGANGRNLQNKVLKNGPPRLIEQGTFPASFTVKGQQYSFIVITPQFKEWPASGDVHLLIAHLKTLLRIDENRIYVTGLSMGGGVTWGALSENQAQAKKIAASVVVCGAWDLQPKLANVIAEDNTPVWALHNDNDPTVPLSYSQGWVRAINGHVPAPNPAAKLTIFQSHSHDAWSKAYDPAYKENGMNVYEWMLQYSTGTAASPAPAPAPPRGNKTINVPANSYRQIYYPDVMTTLNVQPGDTLCIAAGDYDYIYFNKLEGTAAKPIIIKNCGGLVRVGVRSTASNGAFVLSRSKYFKIEGDGAPGVTYGFDVNGTNAKGNIMYGFFLGDGCTDYELHHAYIHDCGTFIQAKTLQQCAHPEWLEGAFVMRNVKIHDTKCRNSAWEGFYIGNTHYLFSEGSCKDMKSHHVENLEVYNNDLENMGSDGIQISMADLGNNLVHHNRVVNYATSKNAAHGYGILSGGGSTLRIYNNRIDKGYNCGIQIFGSGINYVYNNVVSNVEYEGINVTDKLVFQPATGYIYNNTIYNTDINAIKIYADLTTVGHKIYNNLVIAKGSSYDYPQKGFYFRGAHPIKFDAANNLSYTTIDKAYFENAGGGNVKLTAKSEAVNAGRDMTDFGLKTDMDDHSRPVSGKFDVGAYEFNGTPAANLPPVADAGKDQVYTLPISLVTQLDGSNSKDPDGTIKSYSWKKKTGPLLGTIVTPNAAKTTLAALVAGVYVFELTVTDDKGATNADEVTVTVNAAANKPPVANAGNDISITQPASSVQLNGSNSKDDDGNISSYTWKKISGAAGETIVTPNSSKTNVTGLKPGTYVFELTVKDDRGSSSADRVTVTVYPQKNELPVARAGVDKTITLPLNTVELNGSTSSDADGRITKYSWQKISGPAPGVLSAPAAAKTNATGLAAGVYEFELTVTDDDNATASDRVRVTVLQASPANQPPVAKAGNDITITLPTSSTQLNGSGSTDTDGSIKAYAWKQLSGPSTIKIASPAASITGVSGFIAGSYSFELTVTDDKNATATDRVTVNVNKAPNKAPLARAGNDISITLPVNSVQLDGRSSSDPDGSISAYAWKKISGPAGATIGTPSSGTTRVTSLLAGSYIFELTVTDNGGATASDRVNVTVAPEPTNDAPLAKAGNDITITLPVSSTQLNGSASSDPDGSIKAYAWKQLSGPSTIKIASPNASITGVSGFIQGSYSFELKVTDNRNATATDRVTVTVNKAPNKTPTANAGANKTITLPVNSVQLDGGGSSDPDGSISSYSWIKVSGPAGGAISSAKSKTTNITGLTAGSYEYQLTVADNEGATASDRVTITVHPEPRVNKSPVAITSADQRITLPVSQLYINGRSSYDPDGNITAYAWKQVSGPSTAAIAHADWTETLVSGLKQGAYVFELKVTDNDGATATDRITITVAAAPPVSNKPPIAVTQGDQVIQSPLSYAYVTGKKSYDPDGSISSYSWKQLSGPANAAIEAANQAETRIIGLKQGKYTFQLTVTDNKQAFASATFTIDVLADKATRPIDSVAIWPNPAISFLRAAVRYMGTGDKLYFSVYDMTGRSQALFTHPLTDRTLQKNLDISQLPAGYYMLEIKDEKNQFRWAGKFLKAGN